MSKNIINKLNTTFSSNSTTFGNNSNANSIGDSSVNSIDSASTNARNSDMTIAEFTVPIMDKDAMLEAEYDEAMKKWKKSLAALMSVSQHELELADKYAEDTHMPYDAITRLKKQIARTEETLKALNDARSNLINYRFNR